MLLKLIKWILLSQSGSSEKQPSVSRRFHAPILDPIRKPWPLCSIFSFITKSPLEKIWTDREDHWQSWKNRINAAIAIMKDMEKTQTKPTVAMIQSLFEMEEPKKKILILEKKKEKENQPNFTSVINKSIIKNTMYITITAQKLGGFLFPKFGRLRSIIWVRKPRGGAGGHGTFFQSTRRRNIRWGSSKGNRRQHR